MVLRRRRDLPPKALQTRVRQTAAIERSIIGSSPISIIGVAGQQVNGTGGCPGPARTFKSMATTIVIHHCRLTVRGPAV